jgi:hypothetical protein
LHACEITAQDASYATQRANVYVTPGGTAAFEVASDCDVQFDVLHVGMPPLKRDPPGPLKEAARMLKEIEHHAMHASRTAEECSVLNFASLEKDVEQCAALLCVQLGIQPVEP